MSRSDRADRGLRQGQVKVVLRCMGGVSAISVKGASADVMTICESWAASACVGPVTDDEWPSSTSRRGPMYRKRQQDLRRIRRELKRQNPQDS